MKLKWIAFLCVAGICVLAGACQEDTLKPVPQRVRTYLHFLNVYTGAEKIDLKLNSFGENRTLVSGLASMKAWPSQGYASLLTYETDSVAPDSARLAIIDHDQRDTLVPVIGFQLSPRTKASYILLDSVGKPLLVRTIDSISQPDPGKAYVRFMNLCYPLRSVSLISAADDSLEISRMTFLNYSSFKRTKTGLSTFYFHNDLANSRIDSLKVDIRPGKVYSFYLALTNGSPIPGVEILE
ncbi:MAG: hypothetical protein EAZ89_09605 [Bacteroidetes bacterium]|nr:MAG: hypothetical protein EAZ89_09605 [Bacteroidota bacterium]